MKYRHCLEGLRLEVCACGGGAAQEADGGMRALQGRAWGGRVPASGTNEN